jgi:hypothetical protein
MRHDNGVSLEAAAQVGGVKEQRLQHVLLTAECVDYRHAQRCRLLSPDSMVRRFQVLGGRGE